jgi:hypothetical protein
MNIPKMITSVRKPKPHIYVKNISKSRFTIVEINDYILESGEVVDLLNFDLKNHYGDYTSAKKALEYLENTSLYKGIHSEPAKLSYYVVIDE